MKRKDGLVLKIILKYITFASIKDLFFDDKNSWKTKLEN